MIDTIAPRFLAALRDAARRHLGDGDPFRAALDAAAVDPGPAAAVAVQEAMAGLDPALREALLRETHRALAADPAAILAQWSPAAGPRQ